MQTRLSEVLKELRGQDTLREAAEKTGISHTYLNILEKGIDPRSGNILKPSAETLQKLARAYNYPYKKLLELAGYLDRNEPGGAGGNNGGSAPVELEKILRESNIMLDGTVLDDEDKEDIIQFIKAAFRAIKKRKGQSE